MKDNEFAVGDIIDVSYNVDWILDNPLTNNGYVYIYPCDVTDYFQSAHWTFTTAPGNCMAADNTGDAAFVTGSPVCDSTTHQLWPVTPNYSTDGKVNTCFKAVVIRGPDTVICESDPFTVLEGAECAV